MTVSGGTGTGGGFGGKKNSVRTTDWMWGGGALRRNLDKRSSSQVQPSSGELTYAEGCSNEVLPFDDDPNGSGEKKPASSEQDEGAGPRVVYERTPDPLKVVIFQTMDDASYSTTAKYVSIVMMLIIVLSTICFVLETEATNEGGIMYGSNADHVFEIIEGACVSVFTGEYLLRLATCPAVRRFVFEPMNIIDLIAWVPYWVTVGMSDGSSFGFVRIIRLVRVFRVFKFGRYSVGIQMFMGAIVKSRQPLMVLVFMVGISTTIISSIMYLFEDNPSNDMLTSLGMDLSAHDVCFGTIPRAFWWCLVTMTTVGYGDCYPLSFAGKSLAMLTMLLGVLILALPITVVGSNFHKMVEMFEEDVDEMAYADKDDSGCVDSWELREFIRKKKKEGVMRRGVDLNVVRPRLPLEPLRMFLPLRT